MSTNLTKRSGSCGGWLVGTVSSVLSPTLIHIRGQSSSWVSFQGSNDDCSRYPKKWRSRPSSDRRDVDALQPQILSTVHLISLVRKIFPDLFQRSRSHLVWAVGPFYSSNTIDRQSPWKGTTNLLLWTSVRPQLYASPARGAFIHYPVWWTRVFEDGQIYSHSTLSPRRPRPKSRV
jgi:hypothetical protein